MSPLSPIRTIMVTYFSHLKRVCWVLTVTCLSPPYTGEKVLKRGKNPFCDVYSLGLIFSLSDSFYLKILWGFQNWSEDRWSQLDSALPAGTILVLASKPRWLYAFGFFGEISMAEDKFIFVVVYRKLWILLASSRPASSHSFYTGQLMLPTLLFMPPNSSWARVRGGCKSCFWGRWCVGVVVINSSCCWNRSLSRVLDPRGWITPQVCVCVLKCIICLDCSSIIWL